MTTEPAPDGGTSRRKFDDVASLYRPVGADGGAKSSFPPHRPAFIPLPPTYTAPVKRPEPVPPREADEDAQAADDELPAAAFAEIVPMAPAATRIEPVLSVQRPAPSQAARPGPNEIPWPDAFQPRPNYRQPERSNWTWLLLIPAGLVAAAAITMVDPRSIRTWVDTNLLHRTPIAGTLDSPLLPGAFRNSGSSKAAPARDATQASPSPTTASPTTASPTTAEPSPALSDSVQTPALVIPPAGTIPPPPPVPTAPSQIHVNIQFRRNIPGADGEARRIAALLQSSGGSIELHPNVTTVRAATITYYNPPDKDAASALATVLANEATSWIVRLGTAKNTLGTIDVWLP